MYICNVLKNINKMAKIVVRTGDKVKLHNGVEGVIEDIDKSVKRFTFLEQYIIWFHLRDIKELNEKEVSDYDDVDC